MVFVKHSAGDVWSHKGRALRVVEVVESDGETIVVLEGHEGFGRPAFLRANGYRRVHCAAAPAAQPAREERRRRREAR